MILRRAWGLAATVAALVLMLSGCGTAESRSAEGWRSPSPSASPTSAAPENDAGPVRVAVVGDSNSTGFRGTLEAGVADRAAWVAQLPPERFVWAGGWARDGATTEMMAENTSAIDADVLVMMGGTNDLAFGLDFESSAAHLVRTAERAGVAFIAVAAIAPFDIRPADAVAYNDRLSQLAVDRGWTFIDPWRELRAADGTWVDFYRTDGVHTSPVGYAVAAAEIAQQLTGVSD